ncbi:MAG: carbohydrate kinase, partial [Candidatus Humimicrobiaceae bacterium]|nr:carbohydrate kinase [Candidatus Humimicrobiaceae bacterium]
MSYKITGIGEVLWDVFPGGKEPGGAPANFAYFAKNLGQDGIIASRVGSDPMGDEILASLKNLNLLCDFIQIDPVHPTGTVEVKVDSYGQPDYIIKESVAWDFLELTKRWKELATRTDVICFGTLAQRSPVSRKTIVDFLGLSSKETIKILDINLRQNFYSPEVIKKSLELSTILKLNENELELIRKMKIIEASAGRSEILFCRALMAEYDIDLVCVTKGGKGSLLINKKNHYRHHGYKVNVIDTVGAGDAFTAAVAVGYLKGANLKEISDAANRLGSWVCSQRGPTPPLD